MKLKLADRLPVESITSLVPAGPSTPGLDTSGALGIGVNNMISRGIGVFIPYPKRYIIIYYSYPYSYNIRVRAASPKG